MYYACVWVAAAAFVLMVSASNTENIFPHQILFEAIQSHLFSLPLLILLVLGQNQSVRNLEIGLGVFVRTHVSRL